MKDVDYLNSVALNVLKEKRLERLRKKLSERAQEIKDAPESQMMDFFCEECERDYGALGFKQVRIPQGSVWFAFYESCCPLGHKSVRYITDKITDPYFIKSPFVRSQQEEFEDSMVEPWNPRFKVLYPEAHARYVLRGFINE